MLVLSIVTVIGVANPVKPIPVLTAGGANACPMVPGVALSPKKP